MIHVNPWMFTVGLACLLSGMGLVALAEDLHRGKSPFVLRCVGIAFVFFSVYVWLFWHCWTKTP